MPNAKLLSSVGCGKMSNALLENKDGELAVVVSIVKSIGDCDSSDFDHHLCRALETCPPAQTYSIRNLGMGPAIHVLKSPLCDTIA